MNTPTYWLQLYKEHSRNRKLPAATQTASTSIIYSQQSFMIITGRRMSGCYTCYKIKMDCIDL